MADARHQNQLNAIEAVDILQDESLGDDIDSDTESLASTLLRHRELYGRSYHKYRAGENDYWGPNDEQQSDALDIGHHMLTLLLDKKLLLAPIASDSIRQVLDIGCGTGLWSIEFAYAHPDAQVQGVDLSPIQPSWVPPNCQFVVDDVEDDWMYPADHFDFVHFRCLMGAIKDWARLYRQAHERMKPGGWIQHLDMSISFTSDDGSIAGDHVMRRWSQIFIDCGEQVGKTFLITSKAAEWIREAGFENVQERWYKVPVGTWPKDEVLSLHLKTIGFWNYHYCDTAAEGWALHLLTSVLGWSVESCQVFIAEFRNALNDRRKHAYYHVAVFWAQKPA